MDESAVHGCAVSESAVNVSVVGAGSWNSEEIESAMNENAVNGIAVSEIAVNVNAVNEIAARV